MNEPQNPDASSPPELDRIVEQAAFLGSFDPLRLVAGNGTTAPTALLGELAARCVEVSVDDQFRWALTPDARADAFERLSNDHRLREAAQSAASSPLLDQLGGMLVRLAVDGAPKGADIKARELDLLRVASSFLGRALPPEATQEINSEIERQSIDQGLVQLMSNGLIGRETELRQIQDWITSSPRQFSMMSLSGMGGTGKSALLAELVVRLRGRDWQGRPVVWLDFDHPARMRLDQASLMSELLRQLALHPGFDQALALEYRAYLDDTRAESADYRSQEAIGQASIGNLSIWHDYLGRSGARELELLIICDTFEEVLYRGIDERWQLFQLMHGLARSAAIKQVHVICAGRELTGTQDWKPDLEVPLGDLAPEHASVLFWRTVGKPADKNWPMTALIEKFGGNPLVVKLLARQAGKDGAVLPELLKDTIPAGANSEFVQGFLYTRTLNRIRTERPAVKQLAFPGLALRRVSPALIREVLAGPCGLGAPGEPESIELFEELARQFWLVLPAPEPQVVLHRKDLRRLMLLSMEGQHGQVIRDIHQAATRFYERGGDPLLPPEKQRLEADYHRLLLGELPELETDYACQLLESVGLDLSCVPIAARAALKLYAGRELGEAEVKALAGRHRALYEATVRERQSATGTTLESFDTAPAVSDAPDDSARRSDALTDAEVGDAAAPARRRRQRLDPAEIHHAFSRCDFDWLDQVAFEVADLTLKSGSSLGLSREGRTLTESPLWQVCIASLVTGRGPELAQFIARRLLTKDIWRGGSWNRYGSYSISFELGIAAAIRLLDPRAQLPFSEKELRKEFGRHIDTHEKLRVWQLLGRSFISKELSVRLSVLNYMDQALFLHSTRSMDLGFDFDGRGWLEVLERESMRSFGRPRIAFLRKLASATKPVKVSAHPAHADGLVHALSGPVIELYPILRIALGKLSSTMLRSLCESLASRSPGYWPHELRWEVFAKGLADDREQWISTFVEQADRFGHLARLVDFASKAVEAPDRDLWTICRRFSDRINASVEAGLRPSL